MSPTVGAFEFVMASEPPNLVGSRLRLGRVLRS